MVNFLALYYLFEEKLLIFMKIALLTVNFPKLPVKCSNKL